MNSDMNNQIDTLDSTIDQVQTVLPATDTLVGEESIFNQQPIATNEVEVPVNSVMTNVDNSIDTLDTEPDVDTLNQPIETLNLDNSVVNNVEQPVQLVQEQTPNVEMPQTEQNIQPITTPNNIVEENIANEISDNINVENDQQIITEKQDNIESRHKKGFVLNKESLYILLVGLLIYFIIAPLIEAYIVQKIIDYVVVIAMAAKAGVTLKIGISLYIKLIITTFIITASFVFALSSLINVIMSGKLFEEGNKFISKSMAVCLLYSILIVVLAGLAKIDLITITYRVAMLDGYQLFIFNLF